MGKHNVLPNFSPRKIIRELISHVFPVQVELWPISAASIRLSAEWGGRPLSGYKWCNRELTLKCKLKCLLNPWITHWTLALAKGIREPHEVKKESLDLGGNRTHDLRIRSTVTLSTELRGRTEKVGGDLGGESRRRESKGTYECCAA